MAKIGLIKRLTPTLGRLAGVGIRRARRARLGVRKITAGATARFSRRYKALPAYRRSTKIKRGAAIAGIGTFAGYKVKKRRSIV